MNGKPGMKNPVKGQDPSPGKPGSTLGKSIKVGIAFLWLAAGCYCGVAGWVGSSVLENIPTRKRASDREPASNPTGSTYVEYDGISFEDEDSLLEFIKERNINRVFPWVFELPQVLIPLIAAVGFGAFGGAARLLKRLTVNGDDPPYLLLAGAPIFSAVIGLMLSLLALTLPAVFTTGGTRIRTASLAGVALLGGMFSEQAYAWIEAKARKIFPATTRRGSP